MPQNEDISINARTNGTDPGHGLVGSVLSEIQEQDHADKFVRELKELMLSYKVDRVDISWAGPWEGTHG